VIAGISVQDQVKVIPEFLIEKRRITVPDQEPVTHIHECSGPSQIGLIIFCTINGAVYLVNHLVRTLI